MPKELRLPSPGRKISLDIPFHRTAKAVKFCLTGTARLKPCRDTAPNVKSFREATLGTGVSRARLRAASATVKTPTSHGQHVCQLGPGQKAANHPTPIGDHLLPKIVKCYQIKHFLDLRGISALYSQPNHLIVCVIKNSVSLVSLVSTVSFWCAYNVY